MLRSRFSLTLSIAALAWPSLSAAEKTLPPPEQKLLSMPAPPPPPPVAPKRVPPDDQCPKLPAINPQLTFAGGESLEFELDAVGARAGKMTMKALPPSNGQLTVKVGATTNTFFSKMRRVKGEAVSYMDAKTLRPRRYTEDAVENEVPKTQDVRFDPKAGHLAVNYRIGNRGASRKLPHTRDVLDTAGAIYLMRQLPMKEEQPLCFDVYALRTLWRLSGKVIGKEKVTTPLGEFEAWHLTGVATRHDKPTQQREVHVWLTDDARRLPLAAVGVIDLGTIRATLTAYARPGDKRDKLPGKETMKW